MLGAAINPGPLDNHPFSPLELLYTRQLQHLHVLIPWTEDSNCTSMYGKRVPADHRGFHGGEEAEDWQRTTGADEEPSTALEEPILSSTAVKLLHFRKGA